MAITTKLYGNLQLQGNSKRLNIDRINEVSQRMNAETTQRELPARTE